tara:strand:- start:50 stop:535 length:486 start_codon:yes stop_codon:yes gene_type:complete
MAGFHTKTFIKHDDWMTPNHAWRNIEEFIPRDKVIWEAFMGDGTSGQNLEELGFSVIHNQNDFFESNEGDIVVSNPPFSRKKDILTRLKELDKPFILLLPQNSINNNYIRELYGTDLQIIIPRRRIQFIKNGEDGHPKKCNFDCFYYCYKMNLRQDIVMLD